MTRLYTYKVDGCTGCDGTTDQTFNDVDSVKRWFAKHLQLSPACEKKQAELRFHRDGAVRWRRTQTVPEHATT